MASHEDDLDLGAAIGLFNQGQYLAAHEVLDDLWEETQGPEADFYKGLIQASIAMHHMQGDNSQGALKLERGTRRLLAPYLPVHRGLDLSGLLAGLASALRGGKSAPLLVAAKTPE
ncbi:MAG: putative metal-dependent hydrolase [Planctomycetota bacterium]|jgi:predicted metal-dependent hydrolase